MRLQNRSQMMAYLGATQRNIVWSWCAVNEDDRKVYFSVWVDHRGKRNTERMSYLIQEPSWGVDVATGAYSPARKDHDEKLALVFERSYEAFGYFVEAKDTTAVPREIQRVRTSFVFTFELERLADGTVVGYPKSRIELR